MPVHVSPQPYYPGQEPRRPDHFGPEKVNFWGQTDEVTSSNMKWVQVEDYAPGRLGCEKAAHFTAKK